MRSIELLSPAKNLDCGLAAINHGADAVYIGADKFGARAVAGNSIEDIASLVKYAHSYNAKTYAAFNTILNDEELEDARKLIWRLYEAGADALIIQDMGVLQMDLPPIAIHASTQTDNRTVEKVQFLEEAGFSQVVLARELNLEQIKNIASQTSVPLEFFVHGSLCVSYSGQCYISEAMVGRSANRGSCAQYCRLPYDLVDANGNVLMNDKHLLSLKDLNLSSHLEELLDAGVSSFKIEGRLKEADYVKNITAYYRQKLDRILEGSSLYKQASSGKTSFFFTPNPQKSFQRGETNYFLEGRNEQITSFDTPKSIGEYIGEVDKIGNNSLDITGNTTLHNGDGLCYVHDKGFEGFRVNRVEGKHLVLTQMPKLKKGTKLYRNYDIDFEKQLQGNSSERKIAIEIQFKEIENGFQLVLKDEDNNVLEYFCEAEKELAKNEEKALDTIRVQLGKLGNTVFAASVINIDLSKAYFIPSSHLANWRREAVEKLEQLRSSIYKVCLEKIYPTTHPYPEDTISYLGNVHNHLADAFYQQHGVTTIQSSFENENLDEVPLMYTRHCLKYSLGACNRFSENTEQKVAFSEALFLKQNDTLFSLEFDCENCQMLIKKSNFNEDDLSK